MCYFNNKGKRDAFDAFVIYKLDVETKYVSVSKSDEYDGTVDFNTYNILDCKLISEKPVKGEYPYFSYDLTINNNSNINLKEVVVYSALFNQNGIYIDEGDAKTEQALAANGSTTISGSNGDDIMAKQVASSEIYKYEYRLKKRNHNLVV